MSMDVDEDDVTLDLDPDQSCIVLDIDGNVVDVILPEHCRDDFSSRGEMIATMLITLPKEKLDSIIEEWLSEHTRVRP